MRRVTRISLIALVLAASGVALAYSLVRAASAPAVPHDTAGKEDCLSCHGSGLPAGHAGLTNEACVTCHKPSEAPPAAPAGTDCVSCHGTSQSITLPSGETMSLSVDAAAFAASVHGGKLSCTDCHSSVTGYPHAPLKAESRRQYSVAQYETCKRCHFDNYTKTLDSVHYQLLSSGNQAAPLCTDCHGAHNVKAPSQPRAVISQTCAQCHPAISAAYAGSVHGKALIEEDNVDVPVCTDCHRSHSIEDARTAAFRLESVKLCSDCHRDAELMAKYGISPNVVQTYLEDFHGATVALVAKQNKDIWAQEAVCTDCHGVHDIQRTDDPGSRVVKANLATTCRQCHTDASADFPSAWLSHYDPSPQKAAFVFGVQWFYRLLIPFVIVGLALHVFIDLWRTITNR